MALPKASQYQRLPMRAVNGVLRMAQKMGVARFTMDASALLQKAEDLTGFHDFGEDDIRPALTKLLESIEHEADLNPLGRVLTRMSILRLLKHRLWAEALCKDRPEILAREIKAPVVVVGLGRSGTTRLHRLLAADPAFLHLKAWESVNPVPLPESYTTQPDPRITGIEHALKAVLYMSPQVAAVHPLGAHEVEEEVGLLQHAFASQLWEVMTRVPSFAQWLTEQDQTPSYRYMVKLLKIVAWWRGDNPDQTWVLKTPQHMQDLDALMNVFPDARLVCSHRDPIKVVGSLCSMTYCSMVRDTDHVDPRWIGQDWLNKCDTMVKKTRGLREGIPEKQQIDLLYKDISEDWRASIERVYAFLGRELSPQAIAGMEAWLAVNAQHKHGAHKYHLRDFGLSADTVDARLMHYRQQYNIPYEDKNPNAA